MVQPNTKGLVIFNIISLNDSSQFTMDWLNTSVENEDNYLLCTNKGVIQSKLVKESIYRDCEQDKIESKILTHQPARYAQFLPQVGVLYMIGIEHPSNNGNFNTNQVTIIDVKEPEKVIGKIKFTTQISKLAIKSGIILLSCGSFLHMIRTTSLQQFEKLPCYTVYDGYVHNIKQEGSNMRKFVGSRFAYAEPELRGAVTIFCFEPTQSDQNDIQIKEEDRDVLKQRSQSNNSSQSSEKNALKKSGDQVKRMATAIKKASKEDEEVRVMGDLNITYKRKLFTIQALPLDKLLNKASKFKFNDEGTFLAIASQSGSDFSIFELIIKNNKLCEAKLRGLFYRGFFSAQIRTMDFSPDNQFFMVSSSKNVIHVFYLGDRLNQDFSVDEILKDKRKAIMTIDIKDIQKSVELPKLVKQKSTSEQGNMSIPGAYFIKNQRTTNEDSYRLEINVISESAYLFDITLYNNEAENKNGETIYDIPNGMIPNTWDIQCSKHLLEGLEL